MAVQVLGGQTEINGFAATMSQFRNATLENAKGVLNHAEGKPVDAPRPEYDPDHEDNQWPKAIHHPLHGQLIVGKSTKGLQKPHADRVRKENEEAHAKALGAGYRTEPYQKPPEANETPETKYRMLENQLKAQQAQMAQLMDMLLSRGVPTPVAESAPAPVVNPFKKT